MRGPWRWLVVLAITAAFAAGCSSGGGDATNDGTRAEETSEPTDGPSGDDDGGQSSGSGSGTITVDAGTFDLEMSLCRLASDTITVSGGTADGDYAFSAIGLAGAANISFEESGTDNMWYAVGAAPEIDGDSLSFDGEALRNATGGGDPATTMSVEVHC